LDTILDLVVHQDLKLELLSVDVTVKHHGLGQVQALVNICKQALTKLGAPVDVTLIFHQEVVHRVLQVIVEIGQSVVLGDQDRAAQE
tara:strand:- start:307 stop:567 length:261 start_codon:yes stop_codon:yes gene_type:complete